jgi:hypothetical protein
MTYHFTFGYMLSAAMEKKNAIQGLKMTMKILDPKHYRKNAKMWNHYELVQEVGGHQYPPGSILPPQEEMVPIVSISSIKWGNLC